MQPYTIIRIEPCKGEIFLAPYEAQRSAVRIRERIQVLAEFLPSKGKNCDKTGNTFNRMSDQPEADTRLDVLCKNFFMFYVRYQM